MSRLKLTKSSRSHDWVPKRSHPGKRPQKNVGLYYEEPKDRRLNLNLSKTAKDYFTAVTQEVRLSRSEILERILRDDCYRAAFYDLVRQVSDARSQSD